jgi:hypothetical protein
MQIKAWAQRLDRMKHELESYEDCQYASVTSADTLYGSEVVHNVLRAARHGAEDAEGEDTEGGDSGAERPPQLVFNPYDSRGTAEHGELSEFIVCEGRVVGTAALLAVGVLHHRSSTWRNRTFSCSDLPCALLRTEMVTRTALRHASASWLEHCINFESMFVANLMPYTIQPNVLAGRVDLPAVFLHRDSLVTSKVQFGKFVTCISMSYGV